MYIPKPFRVDDPATLRDFIGRHAFASLVTATDDGPLAMQFPEPIEEYRSSLERYAALDWAREIYAKHRTASAEVV